MSAAVRALAPLTMTLVLAAGCTFFEGEGHDGRPSCITGFIGLRNPESLRCEGFAFPCDPQCGPCPLGDPAPLPTWGPCGRPCEDLAEAACSGARGCRVVRSATCAMEEGCATDFLGCFAVDLNVDPEIDCFAARDGTTCSRNPACIAYHRRTLGPPGSFQDASFAACAPAGRPLGTCYGQVICLRLPPVCPRGHTAAIASGCYTGGCLPLDVCGPLPPPG